MKKSKLKTKSIRELLLDVYIEAILTRDYNAAREWRTQLKDRPWWKFWK